MPKMDSFKATQTIRSWPNEKNKVPIIALTANAYSENEEQCKRCGMDGFIAKPIVTDDIQAILSKVFYKKSESNSHANSHLKQQNAVKKVTSSKQDASNKISHLLTKIDQVEIIDKKTIASLKALEKPTDDEPFLQELICKFLVESPKVMTS